MAKKNAATAKKPSLKERMAANEQGAGAPADLDNVEDAGEANEDDAAGPQEGDAGDPGLNAPIEGAEDEDGEPDDAEFEDGPGDTDAEDDAIEAEAKAADEAIENPKLPPEDDNSDPFDGMDELQVAKLTALKETFGAKGFRAGEFKKNRPQVFHMVNEAGNDFASGTLEDLAFLALTFEKKAPADEAPAPRRDHNPDPILKSKKRHPINSFHDMSIVLKDDGRFMKFDRVGDFYEIHIFDQEDPATAICKGTVPLNATKEDLTRFYWKSKKIK